MQTLTAARRRAGRPHLGWPRLGWSQPGWSRVVLAAAMTTMISLAAPALVRAQQAPTDPTDQSVSINDPVFTVTRPKSDTQIVERFSKIIRLPARIVRVDGFDPAVVNISTISPTEFRLQGVAPGVTTVVFAAEGGEIFTVETFVAGDVRHLQAYIDRLYPHTAVEAIAVRTGVVLRGWVTRPEEIPAIVQVAGQFYPPEQVLNQMVVGGPQQVILKVKVMEIQRSKIRQLGFNFLFLNQSGVAGVTPGNLVQLSDAPLSLGESQTATLASIAGSAVTGGLVGNMNGFQGFLDALKQERLLKILAEPTLNTTNGRPAQMLAGGEFPFLVPQNFNVRVQWKKFGIQLEAVPTILGNGRVRLELEPEVSERDFSTSVELNGLIVPGIKARRVNTQVEMEFGQTYMLAGLLSLRQTASTQKVPWIGELPYIGSFFRNVQYDEVETELVILVTPYLAGPLAPHEVPLGGPGMFTDVPTDRELYGAGLIEVPSYGDHCANCDADGLPFSKFHYQTFSDLGPTNGPMPAGPMPAGPMPAGPMPGGPIPNPVPGGHMAPTPDPLSGQQPGLSVDPSLAPTPQPGGIIYEETPTYQEAPLPIPNSAPPLPAPADAAARWQPVNGRQMTPSGIVPTAGQQQGPRLNRPGLIEPR